MLYLPILPQPSFSHKLYLLITFPSLSLPGHPILIYTLYLPFHPSPYSPCSTSPTPSLLLPPVLPLPLYPSPNYPLSPCPSLFLPFLPLFYLSLSIPPSLPLLTYTPFFLPMHSMGPLSLS